MRVAGMNACNDYGKHNLPGGEVYTAPVPSSVEGTVAFDRTVSVKGRTIRQVRLRFEEGIVVDHTARTHESILADHIETDDGARRVGELGIGMNRSIDQFTNNILFDEKMGDTLHLALGQALEQTVGENAGTNESAIHTDMIVDMSTNAVLTVDDEVVFRDGNFWFESGFEA